MTARSNGGWQQMNEPVVAEFRASGGQVSRKHPVILLTTIGRRSGRPHTTPLNFSRDGGRVVVIASKGGSTTHPDWFHNLVARPEVTIEDGGDSYRARAVVAPEPERTRLFDAQARLMPFFDAGRRTAGGFDAGIEHAMRAVIRSTMPAGFALRPIVTSRSSA